jgi:hypothetical protein
MSGVLLLGRGRAEKSIVKTLIFYYSPAGYRILTTDY